MSSEIDTREREDYLRERLRVLHTRDHPGRRFDHFAARRRARALVVFELAIRRWITDQHCRPEDYPRTLAAGLLGVEVGELDLSADQITHGRPYARGLTDGRGYLLLDPARLTDMRGIDPAIPWEDDMTPYLVHVDRGETDPRVSPIYETRAMRRDRARRERKRKP